MLEGLTTLRLKKEASEVAVAHSVFFDWRAGVFGSGFTAWAVIPIDLKSGHAGVIKCPLGDDKGSFSLIWPLRHAFGIL